MKHTYYPALDGLRTIAVGIVLCAHGGVTWFRSGGVGVDIFFVLSGFLITTILSTESQRSGGISFRNFYARRFLRLAPALLLTCALVAVAKPAVGEPFPATDLALSLSYTANWAQALYQYHMTWLNHCWSLAIEEQFYLLWPLVITGLERGVRRPGAKAALLLAGAAVVAVYRALHVGTWTDERINFGLDTRMDALMTGAALAYMVAAVQHRRENPVAAVYDRRPNADGPRPSLPGEMASMVLGRVLAPLALGTLFMIPQIVTWYSPWMGWIGYVLVAGLSATVLADLVVGNHSVVGPILAQPAMVWIGRISYGIYLLHLPVYYVVEKLIPDSPLVVRLGWKVSVSIALAALSYRWVEKRFLSMKSKFEG